MGGNRGTLTMAPDTVTEMGVQKAHLGCSNKTSQAGGLKPQKLTLAQLQRPQGLRPRWLQAEPFLRSLTLACRQLSSSGFLGPTPPNALIFSKALSLNTSVRFQHVLNTEIHLICLFIRKGRKGGREEQSHKSSAGSLLSEARSQELN